MERGAVPGDSLPTANGPGHRARGQGSDPPSSRAGLTPDSAHTNAKANGRRAAAPGNSHPQQTQLPAQSRTPLPSPGQPRHSPGPEPQEIPRLLCSLYALLGPLKKERKERKGRGMHLQPLGKVANFLFFVFVVLETSPRGRRCPSQRGRRGRHPAPPARPALTHGGAQRAGRGAERGGRSGAERGPPAGAGPRHVAAALPSAGQPGACSRPARPSRGRGARAGGAARPGSDAEPDPGDG